MSVFRISPISEQLDHPQWKGQDTGSFLVYAKNPDAAVDALIGEVYSAVLKTPCADTPLPPWYNPELVTVRELADLSAEKLPDGMVIRTM